MPARGFTYDLTVSGIEEARAGFRALGEEGERSPRRPAEGARTAGILSPNCKPK